MLFCIDLKVVFAKSLGNFSSKDKDKETKMFPKVNIHDSLLAVVDGDCDLAAFPTNLLYQFEDAKPYNLDIPIIPLAVMYPKTAEQIAAIVKIAREAKLKVQARSGGHSYGNYCLGGESGAVVVDMKHFQNFSIDEATWNATFGAGTLLGDLTQKLHDAGKRAFAHGVCPQVGSGGHLTIGGFGPMSRMWGTALDHLTSMTVVLADSSIVHASESENADVFFAMRGAGASFGIVTDFTVRTHPEPGTMVRYSYTIDLGSFKSLAPAFKNWLSMISRKDLSRKLYTQITLCQVGMIISGTYFGSQEEFDALDLGGVNKRAKVNFVTVRDWLGGLAHWTEDLGLNVVGGVRCAFYSKSLAFTEADVTSASWVDALFSYLDKTDPGTLLWFLNFELQGGATNDVPVDAAAYAHRDILLYSESFGIDIGRVDHITRGFVTGINDTITKTVPGKIWGSYPGYVDPALKNGQEAYWGANLGKLERIKGKLDPEDVFHNPQSVRPVI